jgi:hypothetical protein
MRMWIPGLAEMSNPHDNRVYVVSLSPNVSEAGMSFCVHHIEGEQTVGDLSEGVPQVPTPCWGPAFVLKLGPFDSDPSWNPRGKTCSGGTISGEPTRDQGVRRFVVRWHAGLRGLIAMILLWASAGALR